MSRRGEGNGGWGLRNARDFSQEEWEAKAESIHANTQPGEMRGGCFDADGNLMGGISWQFGKDGEISHGTHFDARNNTRLTYGENRRTHVTDQNKERGDPDRHSADAYWRQGPNGERSAEYHRAQYARLRGLEKE